MPPDDFREAVLLVNTRSRRGEALFETARKCLESQGLRLKAARGSRKSEDIPRWTEDAVRSGARLVVVGGGDGTLSMVARYFVGSDCALGVLPLGTGNAFARDLGVPSVLEAACDVILKGKTARIDLGLANHQYFVNVATVGLTTGIVRELNDDAKRRLGRAAYLFALIRALVTVRPFRAKLITAERTLEFDTLQVVIGNGRYHAGPFPLAPDASITEGRLTVYALASKSRAAFLRLAIRLPYGTQGDLNDVHAFSTTQGRLEAIPDRMVTIDGEITLRTPLDFAIVPQALHVRVPIAFEEG